MVYSKCMETTTKRKRRVDRNHIIYQITCEPTGETYIGITVARGRAYKGSVDIRWQGHLYHANIENRPYPIHQRIREHGDGAFSKEILHIVRGKTEAHSLEKTLIREKNPPLNVECTSRKILRTAN